MDTVCMQLLYEVGNRAIIAMSALHNAMGSVLKKRRKNGTRLNNITTQTNDGDKDEDGCAALASGVANICG